MTTAPNRRWLRTAICTMVIAVLAIGILYWRSLVEQRPGFPDLAKTIEEVRISIGPIPDFNSPKLIVADPKQIESLVTAPLRNAIRDNSPRRYEVLGYMSVTYADGSTDTATLFLPLGHWKHGDDYWTSDLRGLGSSMRPSVGLADQQAD